MLLSLRSQLKGCKRTRIKMKEKKIFEKNKVAKGRYKIAKDSVKEKRKIKKGGSKERGCIERGRHRTKRHHRDSVSGSDSGSDSGTSENTHKRGEGGSSRKHLRKKKRERSSSSLSANRGNGSSTAKKKPDVSYNSFDYFCNDICENKLLQNYIVEEKLKYEKDVFEKAYGLTLHDDMCYDKFLFEGNNNEDGKKSKKDQQPSSRKHYECYSCKAKNVYSNVQCFKCKKLRKV
ncbi:conserved Plasmodium protein, unknown function [Plasmodium ovale curtisi]|uniref:RanBP2-type domain-containing protein n=1 Tax=Plasmodium ovale curtisi TaxID=864141 RepID=A0A1A8VN39_PLAOA|nr:conserved Plasmodium protein, unknown function [Plasmodium ovale curtisi]